MTITITHATVAGDPQVPLLGANEWNAEHVLTGTLDQSQNDVAVDGVTITGDGTPANPLTASVPTINTATAEVDFGFQSEQEGDIATVTVAAAWVTPTSVIICTPLATATDDHDPEDYAIEGIKAYAANIIDGVSFDIIASANNTTFGKYNVQAIGV